MVLKNKKDRNVTVKKEKTEMKTSCINLPDNSERYRRDMGSYEPSKPIGDLRLEENMEALETQQVAGKNQPLNLAPNILEMLAKSCGIPKEAINHEE